MGNEVKLQYMNSLDDYFWVYTWGKKLGWKNYCPWIRKAEEFTFWLDTKEGAIGLNFRQNNWDTVYEKDERLKTSPIYLGVASDHV